jgi:8-oxo-dGTP diphosphatase
MQVNFHQKAIVLNAENKFLTIKRFYGKKQWDLPGGAVDYPETHEEALRREIDEETGIEITAIKPLEVQTGYNKDEDFYIIFIGYTCTTSDSEIRLSHEHTDYRWVSKAELLELDATQYLKDFVDNSLHL